MPAPVLLLQSGLYVPYVSSPVAQAALAGFVPENSSVNHHPQDHFFGAEGNGNIFWTTSQVSLWRKPNSSPLRFENVRNAIPEESAIKKIERELRTHWEELSLKRDRLPLWSRRMAPVWPQLAGSLHTLSRFVEHFEDIREQHPDVREEWRHETVARITQLRDEVEAMIVSHKTTLETAESVVAKRKAIKRMNEAWDFITYLDGFRFFDEGFGDRPDISALREQLRDLRFKSGAAASRNKRGTARDLYRFLGLQPDIEAGVLEKGWDRLLNEIVRFTRVASALGPFDSYEENVFAVKFSQPVFADADLAGKAFALYQKIPEDRFKVKFLRMILYCPDSEELRFIIEKLYLYYDKYQSLGDFVSSLYGDYRSQFLTGQCLRGFYFELKVLDILSSKGFRIEVVEAGVDKRMSNGQMQEVDLVVLARDVNGHETLFYFELYSGNETPGGGKREQLDRYISAAIAREIGVVIVTFADGQDSFRTKGGKTVPRLTLSALLMMNDATLSDFLVAEYAEYLSQF